MTTHHGEIVERVVRRSGMSLSEIARKTNVNRRSIYNWFQQAKLQPEIIIKIGLVLNYDFSNDFPGYPQIRAYKTLSKEVETSDSYYYWLWKYVELLEKYNKLLNK